MALAYLLDPSFQTLDENGRPLVGGHIEVYYHNTSEKCVTKSDFDGTNNPFKVPLNSKGMAVIIANEHYSYDVFCYDRFGALYWSRQNVNTIGGSGGGGGVYNLLVEVKNLTTKMFGNDVFIKENAFGNTAFFIPDNDWYNVEIRAVLSSDTPRDAIETFSIDFEWNFKIADDVPPGSYGAGWPKMSTELDLTRAFTREVSTSFLYSKAQAGSSVNDWLGWWKHVPTGVTCDVFIDLFKVREE